MAEKEYPRDSNGRELRSAAKKWVAPEPESDELIPVWIVNEAGAQDYVYADPASVLQMDRLVARMRVESPSGGFVKSKAREWKASKFVRETAEAGYSTWPDGGYLSGLLIQFGIITGITASSAPPVPVAPTPPTAPVPAAPIAAEPVAVPLPTDDDDEDTTVEETPFAPQPVTPSPPPLPTPPVPAPAPVVAPPQPPAPPVAPVPAAPPAPPQAPAAAAPITPPPLPGLPTA